MDSGPITAALVFGAIITLITLIVGRGVKVSELRQAWINDQRADLSQWAAAALALARKEPAVSRAADLGSLDEAAFRIRLRENPKGKEWEKVIAEMDEVRVMLSEASVSEAALLPHLHGIATLSQVRLKADWMTVRYGETGYKWMAVLLAVLIVLFCYVSFSATADAPLPVQQQLSGSLQLLPPPPSAETGAGAIVGPKVAPAPVPAEGNSGTADTK